MIKEMSALVYEKVTRLMCVCGKKGLKNIHVTRSIVTYVNRCTLVGFFFVFSSPFPPQKDAENSPS